MNIFTRYGSQVQIAASYKHYAGAGALLVQAEVIRNPQLQTNPGEQVGQFVGAGDAFSRGWIPSSQLVCDQGIDVLTDTILQAPNGIPQNVESMLRVHWPAIFGPMELGDVVNVTTLLPGEQESPNRLTGALRRFAGETRTSTPRSA